MARLLTDWDVRYIQDIIYQDYGVKVSVEKKLKTLLKFGRNRTVSTSETTVMTLPSGILNETYVERNIITSISSSNASDKVVLTIEGHTVGDDVSVSSITRSGSTVTVTTAADHGFAVDDYVNIAGANETDYNGIVKVATAPTSTTFTYEIITTPTTPATGTITTNGLDKTFTVQNVTLNGQTTVPLGTNLARITRMYVAEQTQATDLIGNIYGFETDTTTAGVPDTPAKVHIMIFAGKNQTQKAASAISSTDFYIVTNLDAKIFKKSTGFADVELQVRKLGGVFRPVDSVVVASGSTETLPFQPFVIIPANADFRCVAIADTVNTDIGANVQGYLAKIIA